MLPPIVYLGCGPHLLRAEHIDRLRPPRIALLQQRLRELRMRGRVREELRLEAEARASLEADPLFADMRAVEIIARIELQPRLRRIAGEREPRLLRRRAGGLSATCGI